MYITFILDTGTNRMRRLVEQTEAHVVIGLLLLLLLLLSGRGVGRGGGGTTSSSGGGTSGRNGSELLGTLGDELVNRLALKVLEKSGDSLGINLDTDGGDDLLDVGGRGGGVASSVKQEVSGEVLHWVSSERKRVAVGHERTTTC